MQIKDLIPWNRKAGEIAPRAQDEHPVLSLQREMNRLFDTFWNRFERSAGLIDGGMAAPRADVVETDKAIEVSLELPGLDEKDVEVSVTEDVLTVRGEKKAERKEERKGYYLSERSYGAFYRAVPLPPGVATDKAEATFRKGVLTVTLPKTPEAQSKVKRIEVRSA